MALRLINVGGFFYPQKHKNSRDRYGCVMIFLYLCKSLIGEKIL